MPVPLRLTPLLVPDQTSSVASTSTRSTPPSLIAAAERERKAAAKKRLQEAQAAAREASRASQVRGRGRGRGRRGGGRGARGGRGGRSRQVPTQQDDDDDAEWIPATGLESDDRHQNIRGRGGIRGGRRGRRGRGGAQRGVGRGRSRAARSSDEETASESQDEDEALTACWSPETSDGESGAGQDGRRGTRRDAAGEDDEDDGDGPNSDPEPPTDEETEVEEPDFAAVYGPLALPPTEDGSSDEEEEDSEESQISAFNGHRWEKRRHLEFQVVWTDGDVTWEPLSNVHDCAALDAYMTHHDLVDPLHLSRRKYMIDKALKAIDE
ncbi:hypothetical protein FB45DRAFT_927559 [Roridomyces roridus]|uniref:Chromo domain-containing protein n=1 Tax=Roridomyces roridus TaxID=1738132 RepID=A0AAD7BIM0_9AGAR|nr:hypothetical protein FB45DRAFT_927559 [Roridomyces roridus]